MKIVFFIFTVFWTGASAQEIPMIDENHAFSNGLSATEVYRQGDLVLVSTCLNGTWAVQISTDSRKYKFTSYSKYYGPGGGGIFKLFSGDYNKDGKNELMACLYNGGRSGSGANQNQVIFFIFENDKMRLRATAWIEDFDPSLGSEYFKKTREVSQPEETYALLNKNGA